MLRYARPGGVFLLNSIFPADKVWDELPKEVQRTLIDKKMKFYVIDAYAVAEKVGLGGRINTIMQTCFLPLVALLPKDEAIARIKEYIQITYGRRGEAVVKQNFDAVDQSLVNLYEVKVPETVTSILTRRLPVPANAPGFVRDTLGPIIANNGDDLPVSRMPVDGTFPTATTRWEKRNIALEIPAWDPSLCIQCGKCAFVCPHASIRQKVYDPTYLEKAPATFKSLDAKFKEFPGMKFTIQVAPEDCTGCGMCVEACPAKDKVNPDHKSINMAPQPPLRENERVNWEFFLSLPEADRKAFEPTSVKNSSLLTPLFEFSGACAGCGETPYIRLVSALFGDRAVVANATGCTSIYGGNLPTTPWSINKARTRTGHGSNSLIRG